MVPRPPRSTLFPTRRSSDLPRRKPVVRRKGRALTMWSRPSGAPAGEVYTVNLDAKRSEEHTSELQSHHELVCRLLLEKKKRKDLEHLPPHILATHDPYSTPV